MQPRTNGSNTLPFLLEKYRVFFPLLFLSRIFTSYFTSEAIFFNLIKKIYINDHLNFAYMNNRVFRTQVFFIMYFFFFLHNKHSFENCSIVIISFMFFNSSLFKKLLIRIM